MLRLLTLAAILCPATLLTAAPPPRPDPENPVDYIAWINKRYGKGISNNAAPQYDAATALFVDDEEARDIAKRSDQPWTDREREVLTKWVNKNDDCLRAFVAATTIRSCFFKYASDGGPIIEVLVDYHRAFRNVAKVLAARAQLRLAAGDVAGATEDVCALLRAGRHMRRQPSLIENMVGNATFEMAYDVLAELPDRAAGPVDYDAILRFVGEADRPVSLRPPECLLVEKLAVWDIGQRLLRDPDGDGRFNPIVYPGLIDEPLIVPATMEDLIEQVDHAFKKQRSLFKRDYRQAQRAARALDADVADKDGTLVGRFVPDLRGTAIRQRRFLTYSRAVRIVLHLHAFEAKHGRWPEDLKEAKVASRRRIDPFSGEEFVYRLEAGQPLLYSVSQNGEDDGGKHSKRRKEGDYVYWPRQN